MTRRPVATRRDAEHHPAEQTAARDESTTGSRGSLAILAIVSYLPLLLTAPGKLAADTKAFLYLDPGRLLSRAGWLWEQDVAAGTITHQNIGYLFPMGPYYWLLEQVGVPDWIAQRLWLGTILFAAGCGARWLAGRLDVLPVGAGAAGVVYLTSPYVLPYLGRTSVLLLPWAALPWLIGLTIVALRTGRWRAPLLFAIVVTLVGGTNASSLVFVAVGPLLWLPFALWGLKEVTWRQVGATVLRLAAVTIPTQLWWMAGLRMQGRYGLPILSLTESVETVAQTSTASEVSRGLGYWYDYGRDGLSPWTGAATGYTRNLWLIGVSFGVPLLALASAAVIRWRMRFFAIALAVVGLVAGVGTYPYDDPPLFGAVLKATTQTAAGLALRNTPRAVPLIALGYALLIGAGVQATRQWLARRRRPLWLGRGVVGAVFLVALVGLAPLFTGAFISPDLRFDEDLPDYWHVATSALDAAGDGSRVLELPGSDFAVYRWGETQDPVTPGLMDRPWIGRELTAFGTPGSVDLLRALDRRIQEGVFEPESVAPIAQLFAAGDLLVRNDTQYERYRGPRPSVFAAQVATATGLGPVTGYGPALPNEADDRRPMLDEVELGVAAGLQDPPALQVYPVDNPRPLVEARATSGSTIVAGDGEGLVDAATAGLIDPGGLVLYSATFADDPGAVIEAADHGATLVVTDGNRKRAQRWGTVRENNGYTEPADSEPLVDDPKDTRLELFPAQGTDAQTVSRTVGVADISASAYGNIVAYSPERRAANALDGDVRTSWEVGGFSDVVGERIRIVLDEPVRSDQFNFVQTNGNRFITELGVRLDDGPTEVVAITDRSFIDEGQTVFFGEPRTFTTIELSIESANVSGLVNYLGWSTAGLREVRIPGVTMEEQIRLPVDLLDTVGVASAANDLAFVMSRWRAGASEPFRADPEQTIVRAVSVPTDRSFTLRGDVRLETRTSGALIDSVLGRPGLDAGFAIANGTDTLAGAAAQRPSSAIDGDFSTAWSPGLGSQIGRSFHVALPEPVSFGSLDLAVVADGRHSVITELSIDLDEGGSRVVTIPAVQATPGDNSVNRFTLSVAPTQTTGFTVRVTGVQETTGVEYFSGDPQVLPVAIAELGIAGVQAGPVPVEVPGDCRTDLVEIDGLPVGVRVSGRTADALIGRTLALEPCDAAATVAWETGEHLVRTGNGLDVGLAVDRLVLESQGSAVPSPGQAASVPPATTVTTPGRNAYDVEVSGATQPYWLVLHESLSDGWEATIDGRSLGAPTMVDGYANGWLVDPAEIGQDASVSLRWAPQNVVWIAIAFSAIAFALCCVGLGWLMWRDRRSGLGLAPPPDPDDGPQIDNLLSPLVSARRAMVETVLAGAASVAIGGFGVGLVVAIAVLVSARVDRLSGLLRFIPPAAFVVIPLWYGAKQYRNSFAMGVEWPDAMSAMHPVALIAFLCLAADAVFRRAPATATSPQGPAR